MTRARPQSPGSTGARSRSTLAARTTAACLLVAAVAVVVAGLLSARQVGTTAREVAREALADQADVVAGQLAETGPGSRLGVRRVVEVLRGQDVDVVVLGPAGRLTGDPAAVAAASAAGTADLAPGAAASGTDRRPGGDLLVEARGLPPGGAVAAVALVQRADLAAGTGRRLVRSVLVSLAAGLAVAAVAGAVLARLLSGPLQRVARLARAVGAGRRDLRVADDGPREVADVAVAVNDLADALARSEARQREFLLSVSHELRTPLTAVHGFAESLADGDVPAAEVPEVGRTVLAETSRLDRLIGDLLDLARLGAEQVRFDLADTDLTALVVDAAQVWAARGDRAGVVFRLDAPPGPVRARTDARRLRQVVDGLAENALRVTPPGAPLLLRLAVDADRAVLQVRDGGPGLTADDQAVAFERGALHARYVGRRPVGTGLGLALVHALVTRLGGTVAAGDAPEGGAAFTVVLPLAGPR